LKISTTMLFNKIPIIEAIVINHRKEPFIESGKSFDNSPSEPNNLTRFLCMRSCNEHEVDIL